MHLHSGIALFSVLIFTSFAACSSSEPIEDTVDSEHTDDTNDTEVTVSKPKGLLIDNFENDDGNTLPGTGWYEYDDHDNGGGSQILVGLDGDGFESERGLLTEYTHDRDTLEYDPFVGLGVYLSPEYYDLSGYVALRYSYRGGAHEVRIETSNVTDFDLHAVQVPASSEWTTVEFAYAEFIQAGWGEPVPFAVEDSRLISWHMRGSTGDANTLALDDIWLLTELGQTGEREPDMEIRAAVSPEEVQLDSITITHPLMARAETLSRGTSITNYLEQNRFEGYGEYDELYVEKLANAGFQSLRLPIDLDRYIDKKIVEGGDVTLTLNNDLFAVLDDYDAWTEKHGLSLTIDYHQYDESFDIDDPESTAEFTELWRLVAEHFAERAREDLFFELMNEPEQFAGEGAPSAAEWGELAEKTIVAIREHDENRPIIFGDVEWYGIDALVKRQPLSDPNIIYAIHFYDPFIFTHQGASWAGMSAAHDIPFPYSENEWSEYMADFGFGTSNEAWHVDQLQNYYRIGNRETLHNRLALAKEWAVENNVPLILNEFGVYDARSQEAHRNRYYADLRDVLEGLEMPWQIWFTIMDPETGEIPAETKDALGL